MLYNVLDLNEKPIKRNLTMKECLDFINGRSGYLLEECICCLCGEKLENYGNNPQPLTDDCSDRCCDDCNWKKVIPARIKELISDADELRFLDDKS